MLVVMGLAALLSACGGQRLHTSVPKLDWSKAERRAIDIDDWGSLNSGYATVGYLAGDASRCRIQPCYDMVAEGVDTTGEGDTDYIRVTIDTRIVNPEMYYHGPRFKARVIFHVENQDGDMDYAWVDNEGGNPGYDGRYDRDEPVSVELEEYIVDLLIEQRVQEDLYE